MKVHVVDYGVGNLHSILRALDAVGGEGILTGSVDEITKADRVILPGVGAFGHCAEQLSRAGLVDVVLEFAESGRPLLGICVGMQLLFDESCEFGQHAGLKLIPGAVTAIPTSDATGDRKVPNIGWRALRKADAAATWQGSILEDLTPGLSSAYFVHSFSCVPNHESDRLADIDYEGYRICAAVRHNNITGLQCHPERSGPAGLRIMAAFLK